jgi:hypothetical protein
VFFLRVARISVTKAGNRQKCEAFGKAPVKGGLGPDMAGSGLRRLMLSILAALAQIWPEVASEGSF